MIFVENVSIWNNKFSYKKSKVSKKIFLRV